MKKGAIELSIGTIVIIVLAMSMLILGMVLVKNIFRGATNVIDLNNDQISSEIAKIYGDDKRLVIYPSVDVFEVKPGKESAFAIRVRNLLENVDASDVTFSYETTLDDYEECGLSENDIFGWMKGESGTIGEIRSSGEHIEKILIEVGEGAPLCSFKTRISVKQNDAPYDSAQMFIKIKG